MITITFPSGDKKEFNTGISGEEIASSISKSLLKSAIAIEINDKLYDLDTKIHTSSSIKIITEKDPIGLDIIRHDAAHILAQACKELFQDIQVTIGPSIENGFYYDFYKEEPFHESDLEIIENKMLEISKRNLKFERQVWNKIEAINYFKSIKENYKAEIIDSLPDNEIITIYKQGEFLDLCRGPHSPSTGRIKYFKLMKLAGAYWKGDSNNVMLQRIYGTAWASKQDLENYLTFLKEAENRDHRKLGKLLELFHFQEESQGMAYWHPNGSFIYNKIQEYLRVLLIKDGYKEVKTPQMADRKLWEDSGHWSKFQDNMYSLEVDKKIYSLKPMNCPCHIQIFNKGTRSYKDMPLRLFEYGSCYRKEHTGALHGLMRVNNFIQDDAHIFCTQEQVTSEVIKFSNLLFKVYKDFGFKDIKIRFSDRPKVRAGSDEVWDQSESALIDAVKALNYDYSINKGEGAFYGPKLEYVLKDAINREWQCGTIQIDLVLPKRLKANYIDNNGEKKVPVMLHRAIFGSFERFIGILIEQYSGKFPIWLAPVQIVICSISDKTENYAKNIQNILIDRSIRSELDISAEKISYKIRNAFRKKIPLIGVVGKSEENSNMISLRMHGSDTSKELDINSLIELINKESKKFS